MSASGGYFATDSTVVDSCKLPMGLNLCGYDYCGAGPGLVALMGAKAANGGPHPAGAFVLPAGRAGGSFSDAALAVAGSAEEPVDVIAEIIRGDRILPPSITLAKSKQQQQANADANTTMLLLSEPGGMLARTPRGNYRQTHRAAHSGARGS